MSRRDESREYENDVFYEVWRRGGDTDCINPDRVSDYYWNDVSTSAAASRELERMRPKLGIEESYPEEQFPEEPTEGDRQG
jgi:hypothetical protein